MVEMSNMSKNQHQDHNMSCHDNCCNTVISAIAVITVISYYG